MNTTIFITGFSYKLGGGGRGGAFILIVLDKKRTGDTRLCMIKFTGKTFELNCCGCLVLWGCTVGVRLSIEVYNIC